MSLKIENRYKSIKVNDKHWNPNSKEVLGISHPNHIAFVGATMSGKTNLCLEILKRLACFHKIMIFTSEPDQALFKDLAIRLEDIELPTNEPMLSIHRGLEAIPDIKDPDQHDPRYQTLMIFDDLIGEGSTVLCKALHGLFAHGRHKNISLWFISQSYTEIPKRIRANIRYMFLKSILSKRDRNMMGSDLEMGEDELKYIEDIDNMTQYLLVDKMANRENGRFKRG